MYRSGDRATELEKFEDQYDSGGPRDEAIKPRWKIRSETKTHQLKHYRAEHGFTDRAPRRSATRHIREVLSDDVFQAEKGCRPAYVVAAERSLDQILEVAHDMGEILIARQFDDAV